ncbi:sulfotransferase family 2 domain-containing protein [Microbulbifer sp. JMSA004]|uniref:sulfotransferase family 2 domain-containing protein n=1 Tax=Microbulbifer sp. JMSA004 TaxID=3243370 RepID=UPI0040399B16
MKCLFFLHIPKTAGTSFRKGANTYFGESRVCQDYGKFSPLTSPLIKKWGSGEVDGWSFYQDFNKEGYQFFTGHFHASKYIDIFDVGQMITFLRDPVDRIVSEYNHKVRHQGYKDSFESFYRSRENINRQLRLIGQSNWSQLGFIGFVESFEDSLLLLNKKFGINIPILRQNIASNEVVHSRGLTNEQLSELRALNAKEYEFYNCARTQFDWRLHLARDSARFTRGAATAWENGCLRGWAMSEEETEAALLRVKHNGEVVAETKASEYSPIYKARGLGRRGFVGFSFDLTDIKDLSSIEVVVARTGQPLPILPSLTRLS